MGVLAVFVPHALLELFLRCAPSVGAVTMSALVAYESGGNPYAIGDNTTRRSYAPAGAVQNKVTDAVAAEKMSLSAALGHACGMHFKAADHLAKHPEFAWYQPILHDMKAGGWARFTAAK